MVRHRINKPKTSHLEIIGAIFYYMYVSFLLPSQNVFQPPIFSG